MIIIIKASPCRVGFHSVNIKATNPNDTMPLSYVEVNEGRSVSTHYSEYSSLTVYTGLPLLGHDLIKVLHVLSRFYSLCQLLICFRFRIRTRRLRVPGTIIDLGVYCIKRRPGKSCP